ncbi:MAG: hypothetical protein OHK0029_32030 [Armatimonadaceae bacterium]
MSEIYHWDGNEFVPLPEEDLQDDLPDRFWSLVIPSTETESSADYDTTFVIHREMDDGPLCERQFVYLFDKREMAEAMAGEAREALGRVSVRRINIRSLDERFWVRLRLAFPDNPDAFLELWMSSEALRRHCVITNPLRDRDDDNDDY